MSFLDSLKANTIGVVYSAWTGNVDPYTKAIQRQETDAAIAQAGTGMSPAQIAAVQAKAHAEMDSILNINDANPSNPDGSSKVGLRIPGFGVVGSAEFLKKAETVLYTGIALLGIGGIAYFAVKY